RFPSGQARLASPAPAARRLVRRRGRAPLHGRDRTEALMLDAAQIVQQLGLEPHPEGGHFRETYRHSDPPGGRGAMTAIYYLLAAGERSHWHRVDAIEIWHWYGGAPLNLSISEDGLESTVHRLGPDIPAGERPQIVVPPHAWQSAESVGAWSLV